jgi:hypothetical protein
MAQSSPATLGTTGNSSLRNTAPRKMGTNVLPPKTNRVVHSLAQILLRNLHFYWKSPKLKQQRMQVVHEYHSPPLFLPGLPASKKFFSFLKHNDVDHALHLLCSALCGSDQLTEIDIHAVNVEKVPAPLRMLSPHS